MTLFALGCWAYGDWRILALGRDHIPIAPSTAWSMLLLSCGLLLHHHWPTHVSARVLTWVMSAVVVVLTLPVMTPWWGALAGSFEVPLSGEYGRVSNIEVGRMSPLTATVLLLSTMAVFLTMPPLAARWCYRQTAAVLSLAVLSIGLVIILSYATGMPLLYGSDTIPMALWTALACIPLACGLLAAAGVDTVPMCLFRSESAGAVRPPRSGLFGAPMLNFLLLSTGAGTLGYTYFRYHLEER